MAVVVQTSTTALLRYASEYILEVNLFWPQHSVPVLVLPDVPPHAHRKNTAGLRD